MSQKMSVNYYSQFKCIADQCSLSCCQEWRIAVDDETHKKWEALKLGEVAYEGETYESHKLCDCTKKDEGGHIVKLKEDKKCPFLNQKKLCRLVMELGEGYLSETCSTFPRQINVFDDRTEYSLATCCPVVVDLLNESQEQVKFQQEGSTPQKDSLLMAIREMMITIMENQSYTLPQRMMIIFYVLLDLYSKKQMSEEEVKKCSTQGYTQPIARVIEKMKFDKLDSFFERNELFLDIVENYRKQKLYVSYIEDIAAIGEILEEKYTDEVLEDKLARFEEKLLDYEKLLKNYVVAELLGNLLMPDMNLKELIIAYQWIVLEYSVMKQGIFLRWLEEGEGDIPYTMVRDYITVISRVTGYDQDDIIEYLENSFEEVVWEWGYLALIVGNEKL